MNSKRILEIAKYIDINDNLIDVGCDHGYLGIYLVKNNLVNNILLTDVSESALNSAKDNIKKSNLNIDTFLTDGLNNIDLNNYNAISISGMGTHTILKILSLLNNNNSINKLVIQSNNDLEILRNGINDLGFYLEDETTIVENGIYYVICKFIKSDKKNTDKELKYGLLKIDKVDYYNYLITVNNEILSKLSSNNIEDINRLKNINNELKELLEESR